MSLNWFKTAEELLAKGADQPGVNVFPLYAGAFPLVNVKLPAATREDVSLAYARVFKAQVASDDHAVVVAFRRDEAGEPEWAIYCGDGQVSGDFKDDGSTLADKLVTSGVPGAAEIAAVLKTGAWVGRVESNAKCAFFKMIAKGNFCTHTKAVLSNLTVKDLNEMAEGFDDLVSGSLPAATTVASPTAKSEEEAAFYDAAFIQPVLLAGERGAGKTYLARQAAKHYDAVYLELQMHPSMEAWEFRAHDRAWNGKVFTVLGKLAEAVHWVQQGKKVVLCFDEFLNMNPVYQTAINSALSLTENDTYLIETGRIVDQGDGVGTIETVEVPSDMLWVVATSNVGANYPSDKINPSVRARFQIILMQSDTSRTRKIVENNLKTYDMPLELADMFEKFMGACNLAVDQHEMDEEVTTRLACNVIRAVAKRVSRDKLRVKTLKAWTTLIKTQMQREAAQVVNFEKGPFDESQKEKFDALLNGCFKATGSSK